ncbi:MAG: hypothetical protein WB799_07585 [Candidatus Sulfotelmatobacter sp.]
MKNSIRRQEEANRRDLENDMLNRELDAALAKFAAVEPRTGLEERVLATLRAEQERTPISSRWRWPVVATLAAIVVSVSFVWRSEKLLRNTAAHSAATMSLGRAGTPVANNDGSGPLTSHAVSGKRLKSHAASNPAPVLAVAPKLDQFPSPQPLSEQEIILAHYVTNYPRHAALIAQARTEELRRDSAEEMGEAAPTYHENSPQSNK